MSEELEIKEHLVNEQQVLDYLAENPDLLAHHPEILAKVKLPHGSNGSVSLVERQQQVLREKVNHLEQNITKLVATAKHNEHIYKAFINLYMALLECPDSKQLIYLLRAILLEQIQLDGITGDDAQASKWTAMGSILLNLDDALTR